MLLRDTVNALWIRHGKVNPLPISVYILYTIPGAVIHIIIIIIVGARRLGIDLFRYCVRDCYYDTG